MAQVTMGAAVYVHGEPRKIGDVVDVDATTARYLIDTGKATMAPPAPVVIEEKPQSAPAARRAQATKPKED
jgi:hypothetical protein